MSDTYEQNTVDDGGTPGGPGARYGLIVLAVLALVVAGLGIWWFTGGGSGDGPDTSPAPIESTAFPSETASDIPSPTPDETTPPSTTPDPSPSSTPGTSATEEPCEEFGILEASDSDDEWFNDLAADLWGRTMRVGTHDCYDRWVFEFAGDGDMPGWSVTPHDSNVFLGDPSGEDIEPLAGNASLEVRFAAWPDGTPLGEDPFEDELQIVTSGFPAIKEARILSGFEGMTQAGIGLDRARPYRVTWLPDPGRLVIDVYTG